MRFIIFLFVIILSQTQYSQNKAEQIAKEGIAAFEADKLADMYRLFNEAVSNNADDAFLPIFSAAGGYLDERKLDKAETLLNYLGGFYPGSPGVFYLLGVLKNLQKDYKNAIGFLLISIDNGMNIAPGYDEIAYSYFMLDKYNDCIEYCDKAIVNDENFHKAYYMKANALMKLEKYREAITEIQKARRICLDCEEYKDLMNNIRDAMRSSSSGSRTR